MSTKFLGSAPLTISGVVQTTNATITTILQADVTALPGVAAVAEAGIFAQAILIGKSGSDVAQIVNCAGFKRISGTLSMIGSLGSPIFSAIDSALAGVLLTLDSNGSNIRLRATGLAATNIDWTPYLWLFSGDY